MSIYDDENLMSSFQKIYEKLEELNISIVRVETNLQNHLRHHEISNKNFKWIVPTLISIGTLIVVLLK